MAQWISAQTDSHMSRCEQLLKCIPLKLQWTLRIRRVCVYSENVPLSATSRIVSLSLSLWLSRFCTNTTPISVCLCCNNQFSIFCLLFRNDYHISCVGLFFSVYSLTFALYTVHTFHISVNLWWNAQTFYPRWLAYNELLYIKCYVCMYNDDVDMQAHYF